MNWTKEEMALIEKARNAAKNAYCPYSRFPVGAAVETDIGIVEGCNVENASYGLSCCAERIALFAAAARGASVYTRLAVSCIKGDEIGSPTGLMPCGACRQVIAELMPRAAYVLVDKAGRFCAADLLPYPFQLVKEPK